MVYPTAIKDLIAGFRPRTTGEIRVVLDRPGPRVDPPLKVKVEYGDGLSETDLLNSTKISKRKFMRCSGSIPKSSLFLRGPRSLGAQGETDRKSL